MADHAYEYETNLRLVWARYMDKSHDFRFGPVSNPFFVIWLVLQGNRKVEINGEYFDIGAGDLVLFPPNGRYRLLPEEEPGRIVRYCSTACEMTVGAFDLSELFVVPPTHSNIASEPLSNLHREWREVYRAYESLAASQGDPCAETLILQASASASLYRWFSLLMSVVRPQPHAVSPLTDERILRTCLQIQQNLDRPLTLEGLSRQVFLSPSHLSYLFKQALRMSPMAYARKERMKQAKQLLLNTSLTIREIGERVGCADQGQFSRLFRSAEGCSPLQYRRRRTAY